MASKLGKADGHKCELCRKKITKGNMLTIQTSGLTYYHLICIDSVARQHEFKRHQELLFKNSKVFPRATSIRMEYMGQRRK